LGEGPDTAKENRLIVVVDDDPAVRDSTATLLKHAGFRVAPFESGTALIDAGVPAADVILLDIMMPGLNGLETLRVLRNDPALPPVVMLTGHGDIPLAVEAMKLGAVEFLEKPYPMAHLIELVSTLDKASVEAAVADPQRLIARGKVDTLTARQREVLKGVTLGEPSKVTAHRLNLSVRTVEAYRGQLFGRLGVRSMAEAVRIAVLAGMLES
jgi:two-component system response regulator FixJ